MFKLNADLTKRVVLLPNDYSWQASPMAGVSRVMLDRVGGEVARATSIVRYDALSSFSAHTHDGGEEFLVLDGVFSDEHAEYPAGTYVRNPIGSSHRPKVGAEGAVIFVKLQQFSSFDTAQKVINTNGAEWFDGLRSGLRVLPLHEFNGEHVALVRWEPNTLFSSHQHSGGEEILVLEGTFYDEYGCYPKGSWIRSPHLSSHTPYTMDDGALIYVKTGHLKVSF